MRCFCTVVAFSQVCRSLQLNWLFKARSTALNNFLKQNSSCLCTCGRTRNCRHREAWILYAHLHSVQRQTASLAQASTGSLTTINQNNNNRCFGRCFSSRFRSEDGQDFGSVSGRRTRVFSQRWRLHGSSAVPLHDHAPHHVRHRRHNQHLRRWVAHLLLHVS